MDNLPIFLWLAAIVGVAIWIASIVGLEIVVGFFLILAILRSLER